jgi:hypothetical protein
MKIDAEDWTFTPSRVPGTPYKPVSERVEASALYHKCVK